MERGHMKKKAGKRAGRRRKPAPVVFAERRGFTEEPSGLSWLAVLVRLPANKLAGKIWRWKDVDSVKPCTISSMPARPEHDSFLIIQLHGHDWTYVVHSNFFNVRFASSFGARLTDDVIVCGSEKHSEEFFEIWKKKKRTHYFGTETNGADIDQLLKECGAWAPIIYMNDSETVQLECFPEGVLDVANIQNMYLAVSVATTEDANSETVTRRPPDKPTASLFKAISRGSLKGVEAAIKDGADVNSFPPDREFTPLGKATEYASQKGTPKTIERLIDAGADPDNGGEFCTVAIAGQAIGQCEKKAMTVIHTLVERGASVNGRGEFGMTAIEFAGHGGMLPALKLLVKLGADVTRTSDAAKWLMDKKGSVSKVHLIDRLRANVDFSVGPENVKSCIEFLNQVRAKKIRRSDIEDFKTLVAMASDKLRELRNAVRDRKSTNR